MLIIPDIHEGGEIELWLRSVEIGSFVVRYSEEVARMASKD